MIEFKYLSAFIFGLMSSGHCLGMCGGISAAFGITTAQQPFLRRLSRLFAYNCGRIACYTLLGLLLGYLGQLSVQIFASLMLPLRVFAALMLMAMACYVGQWWMGITAMERAGQCLWKHIQPLSLRLKPAQGFSAAFAFGACWGLLPCGLVYSMLVWVSASADSLSAALLMFCFGLGTFPAMLLTGYLSGQGAGRLQVFLQKQPVRHMVAALLFLFGLWTLFAALSHTH